MYRFLKSTVESVGKYKIFKYVLITNTVFGVALRSGGDVVQQKIEKNYAINAFSKQPDSCDVDYFRTDWTRTSLVSLCL